MSTVLGNQSCYFIQQSSLLGDRLDGARDLDAGTVETLFIFHRGEIYPSLAALTRRWTSVFVKLGGFLAYRGHARSLLYMQELVTRTCGDSKPGPVYPLSRLGRSDYSRVHQIVLLWPDASGLGWLPIERQVFAHTRQDTPVYVLNGRHRLFRLDRRQWRTIRLKRLLEKSFLLECIMVMVFAVTAPPLAVWDGLVQSRAR